ncbi:hypothetical protein ACJIZ3_022564 [Penstemon smallii]|uniref:Serine/threonine-protein phosphatase 4 regulatory subunit 2 n=1 Tax=Penstemon smallii TaxID=265156 RepID=A0ABD3TNX0_9LAMI
METAAKETLENSTVSENVVVEQNHENLVPDVPNHGGTESEVIFSKEEVIGTLEKSASTGKFWQDWEKLKSILSYHLKQVLLEYPEAKMTSEQQSSLLGETYQELVKRLDDALHSFDEGPPFTLQRLCEILLSARSIYPKLLKLSLALDKNLSVTSTLTVSTDLYPLDTTPNTNGAHEGSENAEPQITSVENGVKPASGDTDEVMAEVEEAEVDEEMAMDMETIEEIVRSSEADPAPAADPTPTADPSTT